MNTSTRLALKILLGIALAISLTYASEEVFNNGAHKHWNNIQKSFGFK